EDLVERLDASEWVSLPGHVSDTELVDLYRRAWLVASASAAEGWGMTITEAAACGTPAVVTDIGGHPHAAVPALTRAPPPPPPPPPRPGAGAGAGLCAPAARQRLGSAALARAATFTWEATAAGTLAVLAAEAHRR